MKKMTAIYAALIFRILHSLIIFKFTMKIEETNQPKDTPLRLGSHTPSLLSHLKNHHLPNLITTLPKYNSTINQQSLNLANHSQMDPKRMLMTDPILICLNSPIMTMIITIDTQRLMTTINPHQCFLLLLIIMNSLPTMIRIHHQMRSHHRSIPCKESLHQLSFIIH
jgi:hypothetical protein